MRKSEVLPEPQGPIGRRWSAFLIVLSQTPAKAVRPWIRGLVHRVVCPFTPQLLLVLIEEWHAELVLLHSGHGWDSNPWSIASPALYHMATIAPVGIREDNFWVFDQLVYCTVVCSAAFCRRWMSVALLSLCSTNVNFPNTSHTEPVVRSVYQFINWLLVGILHMFPVSK